jgi:nicotinamidase-related amidase
MEDALVWTLLPNIILITCAYPERTIFTRFIPAQKPGQGIGMWRHWGAMTIHQLGPEMRGLVPALATFVPPARTFDKHVYSPWTGSDLHQQLRSAGIDSVIITGGETDVCVLATMLGAIDWGFRVILVTDALCSSADETHDAMMNVYMNRFGEQVETVTTQTLLHSWLRGARERRASWACHILYCYWRDLSCHIDDRRPPRCELAAAIVAGPAMQFVIASTEQCLRERR